jgi:hypothetical protein
VVLLQCVLPRRTFTLQGLIHSHQMILCYFLLSLVQACPTPAPYWIPSLHPQVPETRVETSHMNAFIRISLIAALSLTLGHTIPIFPTVVHTRPLSLRIPPQSSPCKVLRRQTKPSGRLFEVHTSSHHLRFECQWEQISYIQTHWLRYVRDLYRLATLMLYAHIYTISFQRRWITGRRLPTIRISCR